MEGQQVPAGVEHILRAVEARQVQLPLVGGWFHRPPVCDDIRPAGGEGEVIPHGLKGVQQYGRAAIRRDLPGANCFGLPIRAFMGCQHMQGTRIGGPGSRERIIRTLVLGTNGPGVSCTDSMEKRWNNQGRYSFRPEFFIILLPEQGHIYKVSRTFTEEGAYFVEPVIQSFINRTYARREVDEKAKSVTVRE